MGIIPINRLYQSQGEWTTSPFESAIQAGQEVVSTPFSNRYYVSMQLIIYPYNRQEGEYTIAVAFAGDRAFVDSNTVIVKRIFKREDLVPHVSHGCDYADLDLRIARALVGKAIALKDAMDYDWRQLPKTKTPFNPKPPTRS